MEPQFIFTTPFNVNVIEVKGKEKITMEGLISTTDKDLVNDIITKKCLESMQQQILDRNIKLDIEHEAFRGDTQEEKELNKTLIPAGKIIDATVQETQNGNWGLRVKSELNNFRKDFEQVKGNVLERYLDAYSIAFIPTKTALKTINGEEVRLLDEVRLLNVALTGNPVNTFAQNREVFAKSIDAVEEYKQEKKDNPELENKLEVKGKTGPGGHKPDKTGPHGRGKGPGEGRADGSGEEEEDEEEKKKKKPIKKNNIHVSVIKDERRLKMSEEKIEKETTEETEEKPEAEAKDEEAEEPEKSEESEEVKNELKALKEIVEKQSKELTEIKALLKKPVRKSMAEPQVKDVSEEEILPLDAIA